jgi:hypothetical protein
MNRTSIHLLICLAAAGLTLYALIEEQNALTELRVALPALDKELRATQEENLRLEYELDCFESPVHLLELARKPEFGHLKYPTIDDVLIVSREAPDAAP